MIKAVIVDDEEKSRNLTAKLINQYFNDIEIIDKAKSVQNAVEVINKHDPDIVFLDIEMSDGTGFDVLDAIPVSRQKIRVNFTY